MMNKAAKNYGFTDYRDIKTVLGVSESTVKRWVRGADINPEQPSPIGFQSFASLYAVSEQKTFLSPIECDITKIPIQFIVCAEEFLKDTYTLTTDDIRKVVGLKGITKKGINVIANDIGLAPNVLARQIKNTNGSKISFTTWALILQYCGVPVERIYYRLDVAHKALDQYLDAKNELAALKLSEKKSEIAQVALAVEFMCNYPFLKGRVFIGSPQYDYYRLTHQEARIQQ